MIGTTPGLALAGGVQQPGLAGRRLSVHWHSESVPRVSDSESGLQLESQLSGPPAAGGGQRRPAARASLW